jgi:hypothetical protein
MFDYKFQFDLRQVQNKKPEPTISIQVRDSNWKKLCNPRKTQKARKYSKSYQAVDRYPKAV